MDEIRALQRQLAAVQETKDGNLKLSERHVVDLVLKMQQLGKLDLRHEVADALLNHMGRVSIGDLCATTNVDMAYVEKACADLASESVGRDRVTMMGDEVFTDWYLDGIMEDMNEVLQEHGHVTIGDLAQQYGFPVDFMMSVITPRLGTLIHAHAKGNSLYTEAYVERQVAQIRGSFSGVTRPTAIPEIVAATGMDERLVTDTVTDLIARHVLRGSLRGREYVPTIFLDVQRESVDAFFAANGYLFHAMASQLHVARPLEFVKRSFPHAVGLADVVVAEAFLTTLDGAIDAACTEDSWVDARSVLPPALPDRSVAELLAQTTSLSTRKHAPAVAIASVYVASRGFLSAVRDKFAEHAAVQAAGLAAETVRRKTQGRKLDAKTKSTKSKLPAHDDDDDDDHASSGVPSTAAMAELVMTWFDECAEDDAFVAGLVAELRPRALYEAAATKALSAIHRGGSSTKQELDSIFEDRFDALYVQLLCLSKGWHKLVTVVRKTASIACVEALLLETTALDLCNLVLSFVQEAYEVIDLVGVAPFVPERHKTPLPRLTQLSPENLTALQKSTSFASAMATMWALATGDDKSVSEFVRHMAVLADALNMPLRKCDRKKERAVLTARKTALELQLQSAGTDRLALLALVSQGIFTSVTNLALDFPPHGMPTVLPALSEAFQSSVPSNTMEWLVSLLECEEDLTPADVARLQTLATSKSLTL
ncbi:hypothetical protein SPRG_06122 [Saprolegnia parasitica CBS 223.65]|uniref:E3 UFM1-protein ligase 1-like N-terminal domain-containing protein n=1 Tax=Saprolegnia parasitica (strain CBS 223.65) TaxID=695850 RepID=A0A067CQH5_SAPPC|nr:hypothetical protein SPRG_06122 [Saprolegnia parasitica CBS 223.65]KDO29067.1 hypothetical protein SPRG_06122 [Saprolegnia parasitica CBS 223.65]|eukprot:XP_012200237.1 hypothetical protein SPRG_06122 [Saprolegnia parasitica CBS 223.65]